MTNVPLLKKRLLHSTLTQEFEVIKASDVVGATKGVQKRLIKLLDEYNRKDEGERYQAIGEALDIVCSELGDVEVFGKT